MLNKVKLALRINNDAYDNEITGLINSCKKELELSGIASSNILESDDLIMTTIIQYCKANFGLDNSEAERYLTSYNSYKTFLLTNKYYLTEHPIPNSQG